LPALASDVRAQAAPRDEDLRAGLRQKATALHPPSRDAGEVSRGKPRAKDQTGPRRLARKLEAPDSSKSHQADRLELPGAAMSREWRAKRCRKSTRLNSSHVAISYAVFCLKKKKEIS